MPRPGFHGVERPALMARFFGGVLLVGIWFVASALLLFPIAFMINGLLLTGGLLFILVSLIAGLTTYVKRKDSVAYAFAAAPGMAFAIWSAIDEILRK
jgi:hypothetical protein